MPVTPLMGPAYVQDILNPDVDRAVNLYPEVQAGQIAWVSTPGTSLLKDVTTINASATPIRGLYTTSQGYLIVVAGSGASTYCYMYNGSTWVDHAGSTFTTTASGPVRFAENGTEVVITDGTNTIWVSADGSVGKTVLTGVWGGVTGKPAFLDGFVAYCRSDTQSVQVTEPYNVGTTPALDIRKAESSPDNLMGLATLNRQLFVFGTQSVEVWASSGSTDYPFAPVGGAPLPVGLLATNGVVTTDRAAYWLGASPSGAAAIYASAGTDPQRISTRAIERILSGATLANLQACIAWTYQADGHVFVGFNLTVATGSATSTTLVYDQTAQLWHERRNSTMTTQHPGDSFAAYGGAIYCGGSGSAYVRQLSRTAHTDYNTLTIQRERTAWHATALPRVTWPQYELEIDCGGVGYSVPFTVEVSDNGGYTWLSLGTKTAEQFDRTTTRLLVLRGGLSRDRAWRFKSTSSSTAPYTILNAQARIAGGTG